jgi:hypothetical protein
VTRQLPWLLYQKVLAVVGLLLGVAVAAGVLQFPISRLHPHPMFLKLNHQRH